MPCVAQDPGDKDSEPFVEVDPSGRYGRYADLLGAGAVKKVYRGFDQEEGIEVAWNQVRLHCFMDDLRVIDRLYSEVQLLRSLRHENIITLYHMWTDLERGTLNFITEVCTSGNLREYRRRHRNVSLKAIKKWSHQILTGLEYLHTHEPCIITAISTAAMSSSTATSARVHGPGAYEEDYTEQVDIYSFGMCLLEMITREIPYSECDSVAKIYRMVTAGEPEVKAFIERCLGTPRARPSASELLKDPFYHDLERKPRNFCLCDDDDGGFCTSFSFFLFFLLLMYTTP
ncbi:unnamed protein product [Spirodela intermedia]|uniref:non-specific serine/threonine protein kinase n=1 Tax=Spirodela intermedia TaxID=51605 RepID=A0A7I8IHB9_SPIIN|nr:unnamed protein product [Spirodela intermedia]CAA6657271.1 unnamed protein product [Spirodela intermedia]